MQFWLFALTKFHTRFPVFSRLLIPAAVSRIEKLHKSASALEISGGCLAVAETSTKSFGKLNGVLLRLHFSP